MGKQRATILLGFVSTSASSNVSFDQNQPFLERIQMFFTDLMMHLFARLQTLSALVTTNLLLKS